MSDNKEMSYFADYVKSYNVSAYNTGNFLLSPQILNQSLKNLNMGGQTFTEEELRRMVMSPHLFEQQLRKLSFHLYNTIPIYKRNVDFHSSVLDFDWEVIPYKKDGKPITSEEFRSNAYKRDYAILTKFFNNFNVHQEFKKVYFNMWLYDTYYTAKRVYDDHIYLQEMPSTHSIIDAECYLGYLYSFDLSYFRNSGVDINGYAPVFRKRYNDVVNLNDPISYNPQLPKRNGAWVHWMPVSPKDGWVFKYNSKFAGSVPPFLDMLIDYSKLDKFKELEEKVKELESYKVVFATVPRLTNNKSGNKVDDFALSAQELGKFVASVKESLKDVDFKAAPLENFKAFDFTPNASDNDLLDTEINNMIKQSGLSDAILTGGTGVSSINLYKLVTSEVAKQAYDQFERFCEYQVNSDTKKFKFKIKFTGTIFDREERFNNANADMERGLITPAIFSSRHIQPTDFENSFGFMQSLGMPDILTPIKTASTMSSDEKSKGGRTRSNDSELTDAGEQTREIGANIDKEIE